jgi:hypothetical protein
MAVLLNLLTKADFGAGAGEIGEPITLERAMAHLRIDVDAGDSAFVESVIIPAARQLAEEKSGSAIRPARYRQTLSTFPVADRDRFGLLFAKSGGRQAIKISHGLVQEVESLTYIDGSGQRQSIEVSKLALEVTSPANIELSLVDWGSWPNTSDVPNAVSIVYKAGLLPEAFEAKYPGAIQWMLLACGWAYENREMFLTGKGAVIQMPASYIDSLLAPISVPTRF